MAYERVLRMVKTTPWAVEPGKAEEILAFLDLKAQGLDADATPYVDRDEALDVRYYAAAGDGTVGGGQPTLVGVLPVRGVLSQRLSMMAEMSGGASTELLGKKLTELANNPDVKSIVLDVDSPGGSVYGTQELGDKIAEVARRKKVVAIANSLAASGAYWLASQATELVVTPGGEVGSIGVIAVHWDESAAIEAEGLKPSIVTAGKFKGEMNSLTPLSEEDRLALQKAVNIYYDRFVAAVARGRNVKATEVRQGFGEGRVVTSQEAVKLGMADRVETFDSLAARMARERPQPAQGGGMGASYSQEILDDETTSIGANVDQTITIATDPRPDLVYIDLGDEGPQDEENAEQMAQADSDLLELELDRVRSRGAS